MNTQARRAAVYRLPHGVIYTVDDGLRRVQTIFPEGGGACLGVATFTDEDHARALGLGYSGTGDDVCWKMHRDHDLLHTVVAQAMGWPWSMVLWCAATGRPHPDGFGNAEERMVFLVTRALNLGGLLPEALIDT